MSNSVIPLLLFGGIVGSLLLVYLLHAKLKSLEKDVKKAQDDTEEQLIGLIRNELHHFVNPVIAPPQQQVPAQQPASWPEQQPLQQYSQESIGTQTETQTASNTILESNSSTETVVPSISDLERMSTISDNTELPQENTSTVNTIPETEIVLPKTVQFGKKIDLTNDEPNKRKSKQQLKSTIHIVEKID